MIFEILLLLISMALHELGHYIPAKLLGATPFFKIYFNGIMMCSHPKTKIIGTVITFSGVMAGFIPAIVTYGHIEWYWSFFLIGSMAAGSCIDFIHLYKTIGVYILRNVNNIHSEVNTNG